ncbi:putative peptidoglycan-binding domain-containing protein, partial [Burkholderia vietnamiensis]|uniref:putative peptidoglycan-binding domain-containing protein n=4 Tax=Burkholderia vietnamiensis TaxID=60552 RepID=UPI00299D07D5
SVHNSSSMIGLAISSVSVVPMPEVNSSPRKLTAPRGLFETVSKGFCQFRDDRVALMTYDWTITSGGAVKQIQKMLNSKYGAGVGEDGGLGPNTIKAINAVQDQDQLLQDIAEIRRKYYKMLVENDSSQVVFLKGWLGRVDDCLQVKL